MTSLLKSRLNKFENFGWFPLSRAGTAKPSLTNQSKYRMAIVSFICIVPNSVVPWSGMPLVVTVVLWRDLQVVKGSPGLSEAASSAVAK